MLLKAIEVQKLLGVEDLEIIAYGYTFERNSVEIWFENGQLVRREWNHGLDDKKSSEFFQPLYLKDGIKRWYKGTAEGGLNKRLVDFFETFGCPLVTTPGGSYENHWGPVRR